MTQSGENLLLHSVSSTVFLFLSPLIQNWSYLPMTNFSAGPIFYAHLCNDIVINQRTCIVELGSGVSTILMARLIRRNSLDARIISVDHSPEWQNVVYRNLERDGIEEFVSFVASPLVERKGEYSWYDRKPLDQIFASGVHPIDLLLVDGPPGYEKPFARFGAVPYFKPYLNEESFSIFLHDTDRSYEEESVKQWAAMLQNVQVTKSVRYTTLVRSSFLTTFPQTAV